MQTFRAIRLGLLSLAISVFFSFGAWAETPEPSHTSIKKGPSQQIVESVDIQGNRRLRDEDLIYYIRTREGDVYDPAALERDLLFDDPEGEFVDAPRCTLCAFDGRGGQRNVRKKSLGRPGMKHVGLALHRANTDTGV